MLLLQSFNLKFLKLSKLITFNPTNVFQKHTLNLTNDSQTPKRLWFPSRYTNSKLLLTTVTERYDYDPNVLFTKIGSDVDTINRCDFINLFYDHNCNRFTSLVISRTLLLNQKKKKTNNSWYSPKED